MRPFDTTIAWLIVGVVQYSLFLDAVTVTVSIAKLSTTTQQMLMLLSRQNATMFGCAGDLLVVPGPACVFACASLFALLHVCLLESCSRLACALLFCSRGPHRLRSFSDALYVTIPYVTSLGRQHHSSLRSRTQHYRAPTVCMAVVLAAAC